jgi:hypothetical protein
LKNINKVQKPAKRWIDATLQKGLSTRAHTRPFLRLALITPKTASRPMTSEERSAMMWIMGVTLLIASLGLVMA